MSFPSECAVRLIIGLLFNIALLSMVGPLARWSSIERELGLALLGAAISASAMVSVIPVLRQGTDIQKVAAIVLMVLPFLGFWPAVQFWFHYR